MSPLHHVKISYFIFTANYLIVFNMQKKPFANVLQIGLLKNFPKFTVQHPCRSHLLTKLQTKLCNFIKKETRPTTSLKERVIFRCFPLNFAQFLRIPFLYNTCFCIIWTVLLMTWSNNLCVVQIRSYFWSVFSCIRTECRDLLRKSSCSARIQENTDQK